MLGFVGGGFIAEAYGWRIALVSVGVPGVLLAVFMAKLLKEPVRGTFETETPPPPPPILTTAAVMWANPVMRHLIAASIIAGMVSYGLTQWLPTFFMRSHDLSQSETGIGILLCYGW
jgi:predicted MFS family arabinose efflux permease